MSQSSRLKIAYLTVTDPNNRHSWSGTHYYIGKALQQYVGDVDLLGPVKPFLATWIGMIATGLSQKLLGKRYNYRHSRLLARGYARISNKLLGAEKYDLIVVPATTTFIPYLKTNVPITYIGDATVRNSYNYYKSMTGLYAFSWKETMEIERLALQKASFLIYSSEWAAQSAINDFNINPDKVSVVSFGANLDAVVDKEEIAGKKKGNQCKLLFAGVNWINKGGKMAFETMIKLNEMGIDTTLTVCGCTPPDGLVHEKMKIYPFLNKNDKEQQETLYGLFLNSDFFILPTQFDCTPIVFSESFSFGLPVITYNTGGIASVVSDNKTGCLLPINANADDFARRILSAFTNDNVYYAIKRNCREAYEQRFNWQSWALHFKDICGKYIRT
jgi:glycosyltransferase involved in cell wall biosynthesis